MRYASYEGRTKSEAVDKMFMAARMENRVKETMLIRTYPVEKKKWFGLGKETIWVATACVDDTRASERQRKNDSRKSETASAQDDLFKEEIHQNTVLLNEHHNNFNSAPRGSALAQAQSMIASKQTDTIVIEKNKTLEAEVQNLKDSLLHIQDYIKNEFDEIKEGLIKNKRNSELENKAKLIQDVEISQKNIEWAADFLREREFHPAVIRDIQEFLKKQKNDALIDKAQILTMTRDFLRANINREDILIDNYSYGKNILFAGPTGVGKTVSIIKMAAHVAVIRQKSLRFISIDRYKVGADSQLKTYSDLMKAPFHPINKQDQFFSLLDQNDADFTFIDTAGKSPKDTIVIKELSDWIKKTNKECDVHLVVSATTKPKDLDLIISSYSCLNFSHIIATKLDETAYLGSIVSTLFQTKKPLSFITNGQGVPEDFEIANVDKLISDALK